MKNASINIVNTSVYTVKTFLFMYVFMPGDGWDTSVPKRDKTMTTTETKPEQNKTTITTSKDTETRTTTETNRDKIERQLRQLRKASIQEVGPW